MLFKMMDISKVLHLFYILTCLSICKSVKSSPVVVRHITERYFDVGAKDYNSIACICSNGSTVEKDIDRVTGGDILNGTLSCSITDGVCKLMHFCNGCILHSEYCQPSSNGKDFDCLRDAYILKDNILNYKNLTDASAARPRLKRNPKSCAYPTNLKTADLFCTTSNTKVSCTQTCILGYTLKQGRVLNSVCKRKENKWKPNRFKECEPYVDCTISLVSPGAADCYSATTKSPAMCYIKCHSYEDKREVPRRSYTCKKDGKWSKKLPFCAKAGSNIATVELPN